MSAALCKQCNLGNHEGCTGVIHSGWDAPPCECTCEFRPKVAPKPRVKPVDGRTPLEKLDDAIHEYIATTAEQRDGEVDPTRAVAGWVLGVETTALVQQDGALPMADAQWYASGSQTTTTQAIGLARYVAELYETHIVNRTLFSGDDD